MNKRLQIIVTCAALTAMLGLIGPEPARAGESHAWCPGELYFCVDDCPGDLYYFCDSNGPVYCIAYDWACGNYSDCDNLEVLCSYS